MAKTTFIATCDSFMTRRLPEKRYEGFNEIQEIISSYDVKFNNIEFTAHNAEGYPAAFSGGTWAMAEPEILDDLNRYGFNLYNTANNHSLDYSHGGLLATIKHLKERNMIFAGTGENLAAASAPAYLDTENSRVALIACTSSFHESGRAGNQSKELIGRPGVNPLRYSSTYYLEEKYFEQLNKIASITDINYKTDFMVRNGYALPLPEGKMYFGNYSFVLSDKNYKTTEPNEVDMQRIIKSIKEAKRQGDIALVSIHFHDYIKDTNVTPQFMTTFARRCIDEGADAILGHGPHELHDIEIYKNKPIFYSLGNFIFQTETVSLQPADAYENAKMPADTTVGEYINQRNQNKTKGYIVQENIWRSVMAGFTFDDGKLTQIKLYPITLEMGAPLSKLGRPRIADNNDVLHYLQELSAPYGTEFEFNDKYATIKL
ncbi:MAG: CapA family protein [Clostridia bacterium]|nr:CapA family protein [Clostridia bacterium]